MKKIRKSFWHAYWKLHDKKKMLVARLKVVTDHAGQVELSVKPDNNHNVIPYLYGTDEE